MAHCADALSDSRPARPHHQPHRRREARVAPPAAAMQD
jgi:hypothetical protein